MKNFKSKLVLLLSVSTLWSCKVTEPDNLTFLDDKDIYNNITQIRNILNNVYSGLPNGYSNIGNSWLATACDEAEEVNTAESIQNFNISNITPYYNPDDIWDASYQSIRNAKVFLQSVDTLTWGDLKYSNPTEYTRRIGLIKQYKAEAHFLTAFFYFELLRRYGGVPIVDEVIDKNTDWISRFPRKTFAETVDYIVDKCDTAMKYLPAVHDTGNYGRATAGASAALKARALLYAASDLYNLGNADPLLGYVGGSRQERWIKAARANKEVINMTIFKFHTTYQGNFTLGSAKGTEVIFERRYPASNTFEKQNTAVGFSQGLTGTCPTGNLVDSYEMSNGTDFDWSNPAHAADPYSNRDPRLNKTVVVNNATFGKAKSAVQLWTGGINGKPRDRASVTGYYLRKYMNETLDLQLGESATKQWVFFRLAESYLNYAEAMNEAYGPVGMGPDILNLSALAALNAVRTRTDVKMPAIVAASTDEVKFREQIRRERRVELAFEGHRYWDVKRWKIADKGIGGILTGVNIAKTSAGAFVYTPISVENRTWNNRLYFYPVPQVEVTKSNGVIVQNSGW